MDPTTASPPPSEPVPSPRRFRIRPRWVLLGMLAAAVVGGIAWVLHGRHRVDEIQAELDRTEPGWRMDDLWAAYQRTIPPDEKNSFLVVDAASKALPAGFTAWSQQPDSLPAIVRDANEPNRAALAEARQKLTEARAALEIAHKLRAFDGTGAAPTSLSIDGIGTLLPHIDPVHKVLGLLEVDGLYASLTNDPERAMVAAICCVQVGRSIGDEPFLISQLMRMRAAVVATRILSQTLARSPVREEMVADLQARLTAELDPNRFYRAWLMERATMNQVYQNFREGRDTVRAFVARYGLSVPGPVEVQSLLFAGQENGEHLATLEHANELVAVSRAPEEERLRLAKRIRPAALRGSVVAKLFLGLCGPDVTTAFERELNLTVSVRCAVVAIVCERHRLRTGTWPKTLDELPQPLPSDPFTGQPLKYKLEDGGAVIYSVGPDGEDNGGAIAHADKPQPGSDIGFRLVDPVRRAK